MLAIRAAGREIKAASPAPIPTPDTGATRRPRGRGIRVVRVAHPHECRRQAGDWRVCHGSFPMPAALHALARRALALLYWNWEPGGHWRRGARTEPATGGARCRSAGGAGAPGGTGQPPGPEGAQLFGAP